MRLFDTVHTSTIDAHRLLHLALETAARRSSASSRRRCSRRTSPRRADVGDHDVLTGSPSTVGLDAARVREVLASDEYADAVAADIAQARAYGATGVPFFVVDQKYGVSGAQPAEVFSQVLDQAWTASHPVLQMAGGDAEACGPGRLRDLSCARVR